MGTTGVPDAVVPVSLAVAPNPFESGVRVTVDLLAGSRVRVAAFDAVGRRVDTLFDGPRPAGPTSLTWDAEVAPGVYFIRIETDAGTRTVRAVRAR